MSLAGELSLRFNGLVVEGYGLTRSGNGVSDQSPDIAPLLGKFADGMVEIDVHDQAGNDPYFQCFRISPFALSVRTVVGSVEMWFLDPPSYAGAGQITLTAIN